MKYKKQWGILFFLACLFGVNMFTQYVSNGIFNNAYKPYKGVVVVLDAGHGGMDDGAHYASCIEKEINLAITKYLKKELESVGMKVLLTREGSDDLASVATKNRKREDMKKRVSIINQKEVDFFISIHMNAFPNRSAKGSQLFYQKGDEDSLVFANALQSSISKITNSSKEPRAGDYYILNNSKKVGVLVECGFLSNAQEREKLKDTTYQKELSKAIKKGMMQFLETIYE